MGAVVNFLGILSLAGALGLGLKSLDKVFEYTDSRQAKKVQAKIALLLHSAEYALLSRVSLLTGERIEP